MENKSAPIFGKIEAIPVKKEGCQFIFIDSGVDDGVILIVPHGGSGVDSSSQKQIDRCPLENGFDLDAVFAEKGPGLHPVIRPYAYLLVL